MGKRIEKIHGQYYKRKSKNKKVIICGNYCSLPDGYGCGRNPYGWDSF
jgi:hypothetical protein